MGLLAFFRAQGCLLLVGGRLVVPYFVVVEPGAGHAAQFGGKVLCAVVVLADEIFFEAA